LNSLDIQMSFLLLVEDLQLALKSLYLILFGLDGFVIVYAFQLPLCHEDAGLHLFQLDLLLLNLEALLADELVLLLYFG
jgi:hypothetical protein